MYHQLNSQTHSHLIIWLQSTLPSPDAAAEPLAAADDSLGGADTDPDCDWDDREPDGELADDDEPMDSLPGSDPPLDSGGTPLCDGPGSEPLWPPEPGGLPPAEPDRDMLSPLAEPLCDATDGDELCDRLEDDELGAEAEDETSENDDCDREPELPPECDDERPPEVDGPRLDEPPLRLDEAADPEADPPPALDGVQLELGGGALSLDGADSDADAEASELGPPDELLRPAEALDGCDEETLSLSDSLSLTDDHDLGEPALISDRHC